MTRVFRSLALMALLTAPLGAQAQDLRALVADRVVSDGNTVLAEGNVTLFVEDQTIKASRVTYDRRNDRLQLTGPLTIVTADGTVILADQADLKPKARQGLIQSLRLVIEQRLQIAATDAIQAGDRTSMRQVAATTCQVCPGETALWEIRAREVVRDAEAERIWFSGAHFRINGIPVTPLPNMSIPEPGVTRARGFLRPTIKGTSINDAALRIPYFMPLEDDADVTITPWIGRKAINLALRYRRALDRGNYTIEGIAGSGINGTADQGVWLSLSGQYRFDSGWTLNGDLELASNRTFLQTLGIDDRSHLDSRIALSKITARSLAFSQITRYDPLRTSGSAWDHPAWHVKSTLEGRRPIAGGFGMAGLSLNGHGHWSVAAPGSVDQTRLSAHLAYDGRWIVGPGLEFGAQTRLQSDAYWTRPVGGVSAAGQRHQASGAVTLGWPLKARTGDITHVVTPRLTLSTAQTTGYSPAADDSSAPEYDLASLHRHTRLPGEDRTETGRRAALSVDWRASYASGATWVSLGRMIQDTPPAGATPTTGLAGQNGHWLVGVGGESDRWRLDSQLALTDQGRLDRAETRGSMTVGRGDISLTHAYFATDIAAGRTQPVSDIRLASGWQINDGLRFNAGGRIDAQRREAVSTDLSLNWKRDCVSVNLSASHKFVTSSNLTASTQYGFEISIDGFSSGSAAAPARSCTK